MVEILLTALNALIAALKQAPGITGEVANWIAVIENASTEAYAAHVKAQQVVDPAALNPIDPV